MSRVEVNIKSICDVTHNASMPEITHKTCASERMDGQLKAVPLVISGYVSLPDDIGCCSGRRTHPDMIPA